MHHLGNWIPLLLRKECLVAQSIKIGNVESTSQLSCLESSEVQVTFQDFDSLWVPWTLELEAFGFNE